MYIALASSSQQQVKHACAGNPRPAAHLLGAKNARYEVVYVDVAPERTRELVAAAGGEQHLPLLPVLTAGGQLLGDARSVQELEDGGRLTGLILAQPEPEPEPEP